MSHASPSRRPAHERQVVLLDLDGTLVDSSGDITTAANVALEQDGLEPLTVEDVRRMVGDGAARLVERAYRARGHGEPPSDALARFRVAYDEHCVELTEAYDGVPELLRALHGAGRRLSVVTNKPGHFARKVCEGLELDRWLEDVVGPEDAPAPKPSADHLLAALERLGAGPADAVIVGDGTTDLIAGREAGCLTIAVSWGFRPRELLEAERPEHFVDSTPELLQLLLSDRTSAP